MYSTVSDDLNREHLALETAKCLKNIHLNNQNIITLHKELLEINLSFTTYIEESKDRLQALRLELAQQAKSSQRVVEVLNEKCKKNMSNPKTPQSNVNRTSNNLNKVKSGRKAKNTSIVQQSFKSESARNFIKWYERMIDNERLNLRLYLADDVTLEWFGRTIRTKKKVAAFFNYDMQCSRHDFKSVDNIEKIQSRHLTSKSKEDSSLTSPLQSPETCITGFKTGKRKLEFKSSPEWAEGCKPSDDEYNATDKKRLKKNIYESSLVFDDTLENKANTITLEELSEISFKGDSNVPQRKRKHPSTTPPNIECGQGDCLPSTSGTDADRSHDTLNAQLPKLAVECNGYVEFNRSRINNSIDSMKWNRKCKVQISYSEDPLNVGEYIIWALSYSDESKCRRNLLAAFEEAAMED